MSAWIHRTVQGYHGKSWLVPTLPTSNRESRVANKNGEMISPKFFPYLAFLLSSWMEKSLTGALLLLILDGDQSTKHKWCLQKTQGFDWVGNGWKLKSWSQGGVSRPGSHFTSMIPVTSPWNPVLLTPAWVLPDRVVLLPQHRIFSRKSTPKWRGKKDSSRKSCFT